MKNSYHIIKGLNRTLTLFLVFFLWIGIGKTIAQTTPSVNISVTIAGPYSPFYSDYAGPNASKVLLIVQNLTATQRSIKLTGQLTGDNGIKISTKSTYVPLQPIVLGPNETKQLNGLALTDIFDLNTLNVYGVDKAKLVQTSRLPEGNYTFCIQAVDMANNQVISSSAPLGCTTISIIYPDAPFLVNPTQNSSTQKIFSFVWANANVVPTTTQYTLQVVEMPDVKQDPNQVLNSATRFAINRTIFSATSTILSPIDPPLIEGKRYAWRIIATDLTGQVIFKNRGISRASEFRYLEKPYIASFFELVTPKENLRITDLNKLVFEWKFTDNADKNDNIGFYDGLRSLGSINSGNVFGGSNSKFELYIKRVKTAAEITEEKRAGMTNAFGQSNVVKDNGIVVPVGKQIINFKDSPAMASYFKDGNSYEWYVKDTKTATASAKRIIVVKYEKEIINYTVKLSGNLKYKFVADQIGTELAGKDIQVMRVRLLAPIYKVKRKVTTILDGVEKTDVKEIDSVGMVSNLTNYPYGQTSLATAGFVSSATTDKNGNFQVTVPINKSQYIIHDDNIIVPATNKRFAEVDGLVIRVNDPRFSDANWFIFPTSDHQSILLDDETVQIYDYKLNVKFNVTNQKDYKGKLYVLKNEKSLVKGEVMNIAGETKDVLNMSKNNYYVPTDKSSSQYKYNHTLYSVVGTQKVENAQNTDFSKLAVSLTNDDVYTVYFEPDIAQNALYFSPQTINKRILKPAGFLSTKFGSTVPNQELTFGPKYLTMKVSGRYLYEWKVPYTTPGIKKPLPEGTKLLLMRGNLNYTSVGNTATADKTKNVASTTIGKNGEYSFKLGIFDYDSFNGNQGRDFYIFIDDVYYSSEPQAIRYNQNADIVMPELVGQVNQFSFTSRLRNQATNTPVALMEVYLCRKQGIKPLTIPTDEGDPAKKDYFKKVYTDNYGVKYDIIAKIPPGKLGADGSFTFNRLVLPSTDLTDEYFILAEPMSTSQANFVTERGFTLTAILKNIQAKEYPYYIHSFNIQEDTYEFFYNKNLFQCVPVQPQIPYIDGAVYPYSNTSTSVLSGVKMELFDMDNTKIKDTATPAEFEKYYANKTPLGKAQITGTNGRFLFNEFYKPNDKVGKLLKLSKQGFLTSYRPVQFGKPLIAGQRANMAKVYLDLPITFNVIVTDKGGINPVPARIIVGDDFSWSDTHSIGGYYNASNGTFTPGIEEANLSSPRGEVSFTIIPNNKAKYKTTIVKRNIYSDNQTVAPFEVEANQHSIIVSCINSATGKAVEASVSLNNKYEKFEYSNQDWGIFGGWLTTANFVAAGTDFELKVIPVGNYTIAKTKFHSDMSETVHVTVYVTEAGTINASGKENGKNTNFAVSVWGYDDDEYIVKKNSTGYFINRLPLNDGSMFNWYTAVVGTKSGYLGQTQGALIYTTETQYVKFDFTKLPGGLKENLYGFPIQISDAKPLSDGNYSISGRLNPQGIVSKSSLTPADPANWLSFYTVTVKPGSAAEIQKVLTKVDFVENELKAILHKNYKVTVVNNAGLSLDPTGDGASIMGRVALDPASLPNGLKTSKSGYSGDKNSLYLNLENSSFAALNQLSTTYTDMMRTFSSAGSDMLNQPLLVTGYDKTQINFKAVDDLSIIPEEKIFFKADGMKFRAKVKTDLKNVKSGYENINASATFNIDNTRYTTENEQPIAVGLNLWKLEIDQWKLNNTGLRATKGNLNTLGITIPFKDLPIKYKEIGFGTFDVQKLKLLNAWDVKFNAQDVITSFGFDKGYSATKGAWSVSILAKSEIANLASIKGLPDLEPNDQIYINNINLYDTGNENDTRILLSQNQPAVTLNKFASFRPNTIFGDANSVVFRGGLDMNIPNLSGLESVVYDLKYQVVNGQFVHIHDTPFTNLVLDANGVKVDFTGSQEFTKNKLLLRGILRDKDPLGKYKVNVELYKDLAGTNISLDKSKPAVIRLSEDESGSYLDNAVGDMSVTTNTWNNFKFSGDLTGSEGIDPKQSRLTFEVKGDLIANNNKIGVQNMDAGGMQGLNITYDFDQKALVGSASIYQQTNLADINLDIDLKIGSKEWYIFCNGVANNIKYMPILNQVAVGTMIGNASLNEAQRQSLNKHFKDNDVPEAFKSATENVKGMIMVLSADIKLPILPSFDLDLDPIAHCEVKYGIYANLYYNLGFGLNKEALSLVLGARVGAYVKLGVGASIGLACAGVNLGAETYADVSGNLVPFAPDGAQFSIDAGLTFKLLGEAYVGAGICNSSCETPCFDAGFIEICSPIPCVRKSLKETLELGLGGKFDNSGFHFTTFKK